MAPTPEQARIVAGLKRAAPPEFLIPVHAAGTVVGFLTPITPALAEDSGIVEALYRWRKKHMTAFLTVFTPTLEKTRGYLTSFSLPDPARILFLVGNLEKRYVGHIGLCNIAAEGAEIDNVIRGEPADVPDFMVCTHNALLRWAFSSLDIPLAYLNVLAHNTRAIRAYEKVGLSASGRTPLVREEFDGGYRLVPASGSTGGSTGAELLKMEIRRESFNRQHLR